MSAIYYCPESSMLIPTNAMAGAIPVGAYISGAVNGHEYGHEYYAVSASYPPSFHHPALQPTLHNGMLSDFEYNSLMAQMNRLTLSGSGRGQMPEWLFDEEGNFTVSLQDIVELDLFFICVRDKKGSQFIQDNFPTEDCPLRRKLYEMLFDSQSIYNLAMDMFGNFVIQKMITEAGKEYGQKMLHLLAVQAPDMAFNRFSCRVIQKAVDAFTPVMLEPMLQAFRGYVLSMGTDQSANHVLQKIIDIVPAKDYRFIVEEMCSSGNMDRMICNKFGCRVVQFCLEKLTKSCNNNGDLNKDDSTEAALIRMLMDKISRKAFRYSQDEFANYIVQYVIKHRALHVYRDRIIKSALVGNILSLSQSKYSSHVVEQAFECAPDNLLPEMIKEVFHGKVNPKNGRDSLDQMLFDQYGNYVIQRLLNMGIQIRRGKRQGKAKWFDVLTQRISVNVQPLLKYSSGKKIIETVSAEVGHPLV
uniref:PUM-HD domain-containing protein n=1 Tax=Panagrolaimus sp. ES5 TaxID=591445 RepID=A0AC34FA63_9BILA